MSRRKKDPLRELTEPERQELTRLSRSQAAPAVEVTRAKILLAVARGDDYQDAARSVGRRSGDAVSHLVARFNAEGLAALTPRHGGGRRPTYGPEARARIAAEAGPGADARGRRHRDLVALDPAADAPRGPRRPAAGLDLHHLSVTVWEAHHCFGRLRSQTEIGGFRRGGARAVLEAGRIGLRVGRRDRPRGPMG